MDGSGRLMAAKLQALTEKEKQTLRLVVRGHDAKSMARHLGLPEDICSAVPTTDTSLPGISFPPRSRIRSSMNCPSC